MDKLIDYVNNVFQEEDVHLMYSTPSCYLKALREAENQDWPSKVGASEQLDPTKGGLLNLRTFHFGSNLLNLVPTFDRDHFLFSWIVLKVVIWHPFFGDLKQSEKLEILGLYLIYPTPL